MQRENEQRIREMQSRARLMGSDENSFSLPPQKNFYNNPPKKTPPENPLSRIFDGIENDKLIILALLWVLWNEKADPKLLLALLYLLI